MSTRARRILLRMSGHNFRALAANSYSAPSSSSSPANPATNITGVGCSNYHAQAANNPAVSAATNITVVGINNYHALAVSNSPVSTATNITSVRSDILRTMHMLANIADQLQRSIHEHRDMGKSFLVSSTL